MGIVVFSDHHYDVLEVSQILIHCTFKVINATRHGTMAACWCEET